MGVCFLSNMALSTVGHTSQLCSLSALSSRTLFQKSHGLFSCNFAKLSHTAIFFLDGRWFHLEVFAIKSYLFRLFLIILDGNLIFNMLKEAYSVWNVALVFCSFFERSTIRSWDEFAGMSTLETTDKVLRHTWMLQMSKLSKLLLSLRC